MKRKILTIIMLFMVSVAFAQVPKHLRVLNYVPDSSYSISMVNLDTLARAFELESMHRENFLKPLYDSLKFSKKLVQSWIKKDSKLGVDFTATAAMVDSRYIILPLNNEKNFEKTIRSLDKSVPPFETMTDPSGRKFRCMLFDEESISAAVICTEDVACLALLNDMNAIYSSPVFNSTIPDTNDFELMWESFHNNKETPMQLWTRISRSKFASSELATTMLTKGWDSYTAYRSNNPLIRNLSNAVAVFFPTSKDVQDAFAKLDMELFSRGDVFHDRITAVSEIHQRTPIPEFQALKSSPEALRRLMPYVSGDYLVLAASSIEGYGDLAKPYMTTLPQWRELCPLLNKPFVFTLALSATEYQMQAVTLIDHPEQVRGALERYVAVCNHITDSTFHARKKAMDEKKKENASEEPMSSPQFPEDFDTFEMLGLSFASAVDPEDSTINMKTLNHKKIDGWDAYVIITNKKEMDYETFTQIVKEDSSCVLVKDGLMFYTKSLKGIETLSQPFEREWPKEFLNHAVFAQVDFNAFVALLGPEAAMPIRDMVCFVDGNTFTMNVNAVPGLRHGVLYEVVIYVMDLIKNID